MKTIIAGSRGISDLSLVAKAIEESGFNITEVVSGCARGVDTLGEIWAAQNDIPVKRFPADWQKFGKKAGYIRNELMADYAEALVAIILNHSRGSEHMVVTANHRELMVFISRLTTDPQPLQRFFTETEKTA